MNELMEIDLQGLNGYMANITLSLEAKEKDPVTFGKNLERQFKDLYLTTSKTIEVLDESADILLDHAKKMKTKGGELNGGYNYFTSTSPSEFISRSKGILGALSSNSPKVLASIALSAKVKMSGTPTTTEKNITFIIPQLNGGTVEYGDGKFKIDKESRPDLGPSSQTSLNKASVIESCNGVKEIVKMMQNVIKDYKNIKLTASPEAPEAKLSSMGKYLSSVVSELIRQILRTCKALLDLCNKSIVAK